jgi:hypothetical protein
LVGSKPQRWNSRGQFFAGASKAMRRILIERARQKASQKRGGGIRGSTSNPWTSRQKRKVIWPWKWMRAIRRLALLNVPEQTAERIWAFGRAYLFKELQRAWPKIVGGISPSISDYEAESISFAIPCLMNCFNASRTFSSWRWPFRPAKTATRT